MKNSFIVLLVCFLNLVCFAQNSTVKNTNTPANKTNKPLPLEIGSEKKVVSTSPINNTANAIIDPSIQNPMRATCKACTEADGKLIEMEANSPLIYDTVCKSYTKSVDFAALDGVWHYEKSFIFSNNNYFVEKIRNYYKEDIVATKTENIDVQSEDKSEDRVDKMMEKKFEERKQRADKLGRDEETIEEKIMTFDPNVLYKFMDRDGEDRDNFVMIRFNKENKLENLTVGEIRFKPYYLAAFNKNYLELFNADYPSSLKKFRLLSLNKFSMILGDDINKEIHYFNK